MHQEKQKEIITCGKAIFKNINEKDIEIIEKF
jgi:hypothetical protein